MLRKRSRPVTTTSTTTKQPIVSSDHNNNSNNSTNTCPSSKPTIFISAHSIVKRFMSSFKYETAQKYPAMMMTMMMASPSSVLDTKPFFSSFPTAPLWLNRKMFSNPFKTSPSLDKRNEKTLVQKLSWDRPGIGIALIDDDDDDENRATEEYDEGDEVEEVEVDTKQRRRNNLIVFGSHLKIQIPPHPMVLPNSLILQKNSPSSPVEFGIKTPRTNLGVRGMRNRVEAEKKGQGGPGGIKLKEIISIDKMELSEDYTCVISHGPNPKTTHIFGNCVVESSCVSAATNRSGGASVDGDRFFVRKERENKGFDDFNGKSEPDDSSESGSFLSFCHHCKKRIGHGRDIYMYRGEKAFCSEGCRSQGMLFDGVE